MGRVKGPKNLRLLLENWKYVFYEIVEKKVKKKRELKDMVVKWSDTLSVWPFYDIAK